MSEFLVFKFLCQVLDDVEKQLPDQQYSQEEIIQRRKEIITKFSAYYFRNGYEVDAPDFSDPLVQSFYIRQYVPCHASIVCQAIERSQELSNIFDKDMNEVRMVSIGAGPGTDLLGVIKYCVRQNKSENFKLTALLTDIAAGQWGAVWNIIEARLGERLNFQIAVEYAKVNIHDGSGLMENRQRIESADLFTFSYLLSELPDVSVTEPKFKKKYFDELIEIAKVESIFLFMDNNTDIVIAKLDEIRSNNSLDVVFDYPGTWGVGYEEQKHELGIAHDVDAYGGYYPVLHKNCIVLIAVKRNMDSPGVAVRTCQMPRPLLKTNHVQ